jgi:hypothetical protein
MPSLGTIGFERVNLNNIPHDHYFRFLQAWLDKNIVEGRFLDYVTVNGLPIHFNTNFKNVGINFSGGADSTMLMYMLAKIIEHLKCDTKLVPLSVIRFSDTSDFSEVVKEKIHAYLSNLFPSIIQPVVWGFIPTPFENTPIKNLTILDNKSKREFQNLIDVNATSDVLYFRYFNNWVSKKYLLNAIYDGTTTNPAYAKDIPNSPKFRQATERLFNFSPSIFKNEFFKNLTSILPFERVEKSWVTAQYSNFDLEELFDMTESCPVTKGGCNELNNCFHCAERNWSIENKIYYLSDKQL